MIRLLYISSIIGVALVMSQCNTTEYPAGKRYYDAYCGNCHMEDGNGLSKLIPSLSKSEYIATKQDLLPCIIRNGIASTLSDTSIEVQLSMPANPELNEIQILNICNYINNSWGNQNAQIGIQEMKEKLKNCP